MQFGCRDQKQHNTFGSSLMPKPLHMCVKRVWCSEGHMEKQEMEMKWKLKTEMETQPLSCCSPSSKIHLLLLFVPRHPSSLPASSF